jgi:hypothetical protein
METYLVAALLHCALLVIHPSIPRNNLILPSRASGSNDYRTSLFSTARCPRLSIFVFEGT